jgi:hypothetical protein
MDSTQPASPAVVTRRLSICTYPPAKTPDVVTRFHILIHIPGARRTAAAAAVCHNAAVMEADT